MATDWRDTVPYGYMGKHPFTVELWFRRDLLPPSLVTLVGQRTQSSVVWPGVAKESVGRQWYIGMQTTGALFLSVWNRGTSTTAGPVTLSLLDSSPGSYGSDNQWHHLVVTLHHDLRTWRVYVDATEVMTGVATVAANWEPGMIALGAAYAPHLGDYGSNLWDRELSNLALYSHALLPARIQEHYTAGSGGTVYYGDDEITRLTRVLDWADVPEQSRELESAVTTLQGIEVQEERALGKLQDTAEAAGGVVFADGQSRIVYHNRNHRYNRWSIVTLSETTQSAPEMDITFTVDDTRVFNDIRGSRPHGSSIRLRDVVSEAAYGRKTFSVTLAVTTHEELRNYMSWLLAQYGRDTVRVETVRFSAETSDKIERLATGLAQVGDVITLDELPEDAPAGTMSFVVESLDIDANYRDRKWTLILGLSPAELNKVFEVGVSNLGGGYRVAY